MRRTFVVTLVLALGLAAFTLASAQGGRTLTTGLSGAAERPNPGDPDGSGTASITLNPGQRQVCFKLEVQGIESATLAHVHRGTVDEAGPAVVTLTPPANGSSSGCVEDVDRDLILDILRNPSGYYVNVHNATYPAGALRGQLGR